MSGIAPSPAKELPPVPRQPTSNANLPDSNHLSIAKLHALPTEQQSLYLLTHCSDLAQYIETLDSESITQNQSDVKKELFKIITLASPLPSRVIRNALGRCFNSLFTKGNRRVLHESINELLNILSAGKELDLKTKHAATYCLGAMFEAAGDSAVALSTGACNTLLKLLKPASNDAGLRAAVYRSLGKIVVGVVSSIEEDLARTIWKTARSAITADRSFLVCINASSCLEQLIQHTSCFDNSSDFEKLQSTTLKAMDSPSAAVRRAAASCLAAILTKSHTHGTNSETVPRIKKPKKVRKGAATEEAEDEIDRTASPAPEKSVALAYTLPEILRLLGMNYTRATSSNRVRAAIATCYTYIIRSLTPTTLEDNYNDIARYMLIELLGHGSLQFHKYRLLITRKFVALILDQVIGQTLGETAQLNACRFLINDILKDYPQTVKERPVPTKDTLAGALAALEALMTRLGSGISAIADSCFQTLIHVHQHPSFTVQTRTSKALRALMLSCPQLIPTCLATYQNRLQTELDQLLSPNRSFRRATAYAYGLCAVLSASAQQPLYGSAEVYAHIMSQAISLLKTSAGSDLHVSACQVQVAWLMISGLMPLGPNFVKIHLQQLLQLWRNASPKPLGKDALRGRSLAELSFLAHVRECALSSVRAFLTFNQRLLTSDVSRRVAGLLEASVGFLSTLPDKKTSDDPSTRLMPAFQLQDYDVMVTRRVLQCFSLLLATSPHGAIEPTSFSTILPVALRSFSAADYETNNTLSAAIAGAAGAFDGIWEVGDNYGFGVCALATGCDWQDPLTDYYHMHWSSLSDVESTFDRIVHLPICSSPENDPMSCFMQGRSDPAVTEVVNAAMSVFALALPLQTPRVQESVIEQVTSVLSSTGLAKDTARRAAVAINISLAIRLSVESGRFGGANTSTHAQEALQDLLRTLMCNADETVRYHAAAAIGKLCSSAGTDFTTTQVASLTEAIINNRDPDARAGFSSALASIHSQLGGMAAGLHIKNITSILMSLSADSHPLVHFWAIDSLARVADSAGLNFLAHVSSCVGMFSQLYVSDDHNPEIEALAASNMLVDLPISAAIGRGVASLINVLGPDLQDMTKARDMITTLIQLFSHEHSIPVVLADLKCREHLSLYMPNDFQLQPYVQHLQASLVSPALDVRAAAAESLCSVMRRDAEHVITIANTGLEDDLWTALDDDPQNQAIRKIFTNWLQQTATTTPDEWIARCNSIITKTRAKAVQPAPITAKESALPDVQDEEAAGFAATEGATRDDDQAANTTQELLRWQVRLFAMDCLYSLIAMIGKDAASQEHSSNLTALQNRIADVVRIAFSASTASVSSLRVVGLRIIEQILRIFGRTPDPEFSEAMLLEQYQAQMSSALTPAFAADSSPGLAAEAVNVCATFISSGIVTDVERMGRILKLLVAALESFSRTSKTTEIGDLKGLSANAQVMVRMAVFSAWANLQVASVEQKYLADVVQPHISKLVPLWLNSLREYARLRFEPDISAATTAGSNDEPDIAYAALNRQTLLPFYQDAWLSLVDAIASLIGQDSQVVFDALDGKHVNGDTTHDEQTAINYRDEPVAFFFVLFGLAFEALAMTTPGEDEVLKQQRKIEILQALKKILLPSVSGDAIYQDRIFEETIDLMHRLVLTESLGVQAVIVEIATNLCMTHPSSRQETSENLSEEIEQLFELTRIMVLVLAGIVPGLSETPVSVRLETSHEAVTLVHSALQALVNISDVFPTIIRTDLRDAILHVFVVILGTGACQASVVPQALPMFRRLVASMVAQPLPHTEKQLSNALLRMLAILSNAQRRENEASVACEKNTLLACALLISAAPDTLAKDVVDRFVVQLVDTLQAQMTMRVAVGCIRTLLVAGVAAKRLLHAATSFLTQPLSLDGIDECKSLMSQTLVMVVNRASSLQKPALLSLSLLSLLRRAEADGDIVYLETAARIIDLSRADNAVFRGIVARLDQEEKTLLETILRAGAGDRSQDRRPEDREPTIALRINF